MNKSLPIKVMIVDDHDTVRQTLTLSLLAFDDINPVGEAANGAEAVELYPKIEPDVLIMDLQMPVLDGVAAAALIRQRDPKAKIIALTSFKNERMIKAALEAGVEAYLFKDLSMDELAGTIRAVHAITSNGAGLSG